jgi:hypothetical protein
MTGRQPDLDPTARAPVPDGAGGLSAPSASKKPAQRLRWWIHRLTLLVATGLLCWIAFEWVGGLVLQHHFARKYSLTVDHRLVPYSRPDINGDGIRCHFEADDFDSASTNIVFLGDSFTYGAHLDDESQAFPPGVARIWIRTDSGSAASTSDGPPPRPCCPCASWPISATSTNPTWW